MALLEPSGAGKTTLLRLLPVSMQDVVAGLPQGLATRLGEGGGGLSCGEARRLTLARALHARPDVLLADEPTADLDAVSAEAVTAGLLALAVTGCSLIIATDAEALAARLDRVIRLKALIGTRSGKSST